MKSATPFYCIYLQSQTRLCIDKMRPFPHVSRPAKSLSHIGGLLTSGEIYTYSKSVTQITVTGIQFISDKDRDFPGAKFEFGRVLPAVLGYADFRWYYRELS
jgi:hypothetical protein